MPSADDQLPVTGGGPTGLVLDETRAQLYVLTRFDNAISVVEHRRPAPRSSTSRSTTRSRASVVTGRPFLYDATFSSSHGDSACASCHIFGDFDSLAWDLGNPDGTVARQPEPVHASDRSSIPDFHPMKGPMTTQSLRGMANHGPMHWRGDRTAERRAPTCSRTGAFDEDAAFKKFNPAFQGLLGRSTQLTATEMQQFTDFILQVTYPPNPIRNLDGSSPPPRQKAGHDMYSAASRTRSRIATAVTARRRPPTPA